MIRNARIAAGFSILMALLGCSQSGTSPGSANLLRRGLSGEPSTLDPAAAVDSFSYEVLRDVYEGLTTESAKGEVIPGVASSWTIDASGRQYTFRLRSDARWSNGAPVRAQEFVAAWRRVVDPKEGSPVADDLRLIVGATAIIGGRSPATTLGVTAPSDNVLIVNLEQPAPYLPQLLTHSATYPIYSDESARSHHPANSISNGPYTLLNWLPGTKVELVKNPYYWDHKNVHIPHVQYQIVPDENSQFARYRAGELDMTDTVPANAVATLRTEHSADLVIAPFLATAYYGFNLVARPFASNLALRKAIAMAIDRRRLVRALALGQAEAYGFVPPGTWNYSTQSWTWKIRNDAERMTEAKQLYAAAGYTTATPLHIRLLVNANPAIRNLAIMIAAMWKETLGIETEIGEEEYRVFLQSRRDKSKWEVVRLAWSADYDDAGNFLDTFREHSPNNDTGYANQAFDAMLDDAARTQDPVRRRRVLEEAERMMLADYPVVPLYFFVSKRLVKSYLRGVQSNPLNHICSKALTFIPH